MAEEALLREIAELGLSQRKAYTAKDLKRIRKTIEAKKAQSLKEEKQLRNGLVELPTTNELATTDDNTDATKEVFKEEPVVPVRRQPPGRRKKVEEKLEEEKLETDE